MEFFFACCIIYVYIGFNYTTLAYLGESSVRPIFLLQRYLTFSVLSKLFVVVVVFCECVCVCVCVGSGICVRVFFFTYFSFFVREDLRRVKGNNMLLVWLVRIYLVTQKKYLIKFIAWKKFPFFRCKVFRLSYFATNIEDQGLDE